MSTPVVVSDLFERSYSDLDGSVKGRVMDFVVKLQRDPTAAGLHIEPMTGARDRRVRTGRVTDSWRAILIKLDHDAGYVLVGVRPHDDANAYATDLVINVNEVTGAAEIVDTRALATAVGRAESSVPKRPAERVMPEYLREKDLVQLGVSESMAERVLALTSESALLDLAGALPRGQGEAVLDLYHGLSPEEVWARLTSGDDAIAGAAVDPDDVVTALQRPLSRMSFTALTGDDGIDELRAVLEGSSLAAWRVWLHPLQRALATHDGWNGPFKVTGGAGTGKTVVALHRARHLARRVEGERKVLLTTFTSTLADNLRAHLVQLAGADLAARVDVVHLDSLAARVLRSTESGRATLGKRRLVPDDEVMPWWEAAAVGASWGPEFLQDEWSSVILAQQVTSEAEYLKASRSGRGQRLSRPQRAEVWRIVERFTQMLRTEGIATYVQQVSEAASMLVVEPAVRDELQYRYGVVDEAQDFHPAHWRLVRALVPPGQDDLFIVGDAHQRIYGRPVPLSRFGIETRGRARRLTINYRTSRQILRWCLGVVNPDADDLDGESDTLAGARSLFAGPEPTSSECRTAADERGDTASCASSWIDQGIAPHEIAVFVRERRRAEDVVEALTAHGVPAVEVGRRSRGDDADSGAVRVMTMHRAKGLEFRAVIVPFLGASDFPPAWHDGHGAGERNLLYVAASRAREALHVSWTGRPSPLL